MYFLLFHKDKLVGRWTCYFLYGLYINVNFLIKNVHFQILEFICNGAFGKVYKAKGLNSNSELYAMKILNKSSVIIECLVLSILILV